jgi:uncharacterized repeat protein (TIGR01451 family)
MKFTRNLGCLSAILSITALANSAIAYQIPTTPSGTWTGTAATNATGNNIAATKETPSGLRMRISVSGTGTGILARNNTSLMTLNNTLDPVLPATTNGLQFLTDLTNCPNGAGILTCSNLGRFSIEFLDLAGNLIKVRNPKLHWSRLGGLTSVGSNTFLLTSVLAIDTPGLKFGVASSPTLAVSAGTNNNIRWAMPTATPVSTGNCATTNDAGCGSTPILNALGTDIFVDRLDFSVTGQRSNASIAWNETSSTGPSTSRDGYFLTASFDEDFGDAPASFDTGGAASHIISDLSIGSAIDAENPTTINGGATGTPLIVSGPNTVAAGNNNNTGGDGADEDGIAGWGTITTTATTYSTTISLSGVNRAARICGWVDFNRNGSFDNPAERACADAIAGQTTATLNWSGLTGLTAGNNYARLRLSYDLTGVQNPKGPLNSGEVEDYQLTITASAPPNNPPTTNDLNAASQPNPGGTTAVQVTMLAGSDPEDGPLGAGKSFKIESLPTNGTLSYNNAPVLAGQIISNYDPTLLKLDPNDGAITVSFTYAAIDSTGQQDATPATISMPFTASAPPSISPELCPVTSYLIQKSPSQISIYNLATAQFGSFTTITGVDSGPILNAIGFSPLDGYMYALEDSTGANKDLYRLTQSGNAVKIGNVANLNFNNYNAGDVDTNGYHYVSNTNRTQIEIIDINPARTATYGTKVGTVTLPSSATSGPDLAINPVDGRLYTIRFDTKELWSFKIDVATQTVTGFTNHGTTTNVADGAITNITAGAVYFDASGNFYTYDNSTGNLWKFPTNPTVSTAGQLIGNGGTAPLNDGARCALAPVPSLGVDYGDAPDTGSGKGTGNYETLIVNNGPYHLISNSFHLGSSITADADGFGNGVDSNGNATDDIDDDGVQLSGSSFQGQSLTPGSSITLNLATQGSGLLNAWIDWNRNGSFDDAGEKIATNVSPTANAIALNVTVPSSAAAGPTYARFRFSSDANLASTGYASDGEVEDYQVTIAQTSSPNVLLVKRITAMNGGTSTVGGDSLAGYIDESTNPYDDNIITIPTQPTPTDPPKDTDKWPALNSFMLGGINGGKINPGDELEYTIYFLSSGLGEAKNVLFCDRVPEDVSYIFNSFGGSSPLGLTGTEQGMQLLWDGTPRNLTNVPDADVGQYFAPGIDPKATYPNINCRGANTNGAVVVNLGNLPHATAPGIPTKSYGFIRFRGRVK